MITLLTDLGEQKVEIGMSVEMVTQRIRSDGDERGMILYGYTLWWARRGVSSGR